MYVLCQPKRAGNGKRISCHFNSYSFEIDLLILPKKHRTKLISDELKQTREQQAN